MKKISPQIKTRARRILHAGRLKYSVGRAGIRSRDGRCVCVCAARIILFLLCWRGPGSNGKITEMDAWPLLI
jgi:hypothetical protein